MLSLDSLNAQFWVTLGSTMQQTLAFCYWAPSPCPPWCHSFTDPSPDPRIWPVAFPGLWDGPTESSGASAFQINRQISTCKTILIRVQCEQQPTFWGLKSFEELEQVWNQDSGCQDKRGSERRPCNKCKQYCRCAGVHSRAGCHTWFLRESWGWDAFAHTCS